MLITSLVTVLFILIDGIEITRQVIKRKTRQFRIAKAMFPVVKSMFIMLMKNLYLAFIQYLNSSVVKIDDNTYVLSYIIDGILYKTVITPSKLECPVLVVSDDISNDVSDDVIPYLGPNYTWHGLTLTPYNLGFDKLVFEMANGDEISFEEEEAIDLSKQKQE